MAGKYVLQINTELDCETGSAFDAMCRNDERTKAQMAKWLIKQELDRRKVEALINGAVISMGVGEGIEIKGAPGGLSEFEGMGE